MQHLFILITPRESSRKGGIYISVSPDLHLPGRWPLLPLADWRAGKIPICVVGDDSEIRIESPTDPVHIAREEEFDAKGLIG